MRFLVVYSVGAAIAAYLAYWACGISWVMGS